MTGMTGRSTPERFADGAHVTDAAGATWRYAAYGDVWLLVDQHVRRPLPTSARSWQRLEAERGPLSPVA